MNWYLEHAPDVMKRSGAFFPRNEVMAQVGFRSVFALSEPDARRVRDQGNSRGLSQFAVFSDELLLDFDEGVDDNFKRAEKWAIDTDCTFSVYESGSKGLHLEIASVPKYGRSVPQSQQQFVEQVMGVKSDYSLYRHASLYRLPGTLHKKTGKPKKRIASHLGTALVDYEILDESLCIDFGPTTGYDKVRHALERVLRWHTSPPDKGRRYQTLWAIAKSCADGGLSQTATREMLEIINTSWEGLAKEQEEVTRALREVF